MRRSSVLVLLLALWTIPAEAQIRRELGVMVPMRDGVRLATDVWRPAAPGRYPTLVIRTPYLRTGLDLVSWGLYFAERGYVVLGAGYPGAGRLGGRVR